MPTISLTRLRFPGLAALIAAPAALLLTPGRAEAILNYYIFQSGPDVLIQSFGELDLGNDTGSALANCPFALFNPAQASVRSCPTGGTMLTYEIGGHTSFPGPVSAPAPSSFGSINVNLFGTLQVIQIENSYAGGPIDTGMTFSNATLANLGYGTTSGTIASWTISSTGDTINLVVGAPPASVPGPLPIFGAAAAFGWSRTLRRRISASSTTSNS